MASSVAGVIEPELQAAETAGSASCRTSNLSAYDLYLCAYAMSFTYQLRQALALLRRPSPATRITAPPLGLRLPTSDRKPQRPPIAETKPHGDSG